MNLQLNQKIFFTDGIFDDMSVSKFNFFNNLFQVVIDLYQHNYPWVNSSVKFNDEKIVDN